jgi:hypothetical protein
LSIETITAGDGSWCTDAMERKSRGSRLAALKMNEQISLHLWVWHRPSCAFCLRGGISIRSRHDRHRLSLTSLFQHKGTTQDEGAGLWPTRGRRVGLSPLYAQRALAV